MIQALVRIEDSFKKASRGAESLNTVIWWWGAIAYVFAFFISDKLIKLVNLYSFDIILSVLMLAYFIWHIYALKKCEPKKPELTKEEKKRLKEEARRQLGKKLLRKLFLQEPLTETNPVLISIVIDLYFAAHFAGYVF